MTTRTPQGARRRSRARALSLETPELDAAIAEAERSAIVVWRGERIPFADLPARMARTDARLERIGPTGVEAVALVALNPLYRRRLATWHERVAASGAEDLATAAAGGRDLEALALDLERLAIQSETGYHAAVRRYLALIGIEQGDATLADMWHVQHGEAWSQWFGARELERASAEAGRDGAGVIHGDGWRSGEAALSESATAAGVPGAAIAELYGTLVGDPNWLARGLGMGVDEIAPFADFVAFVRLYRLRRSLAMVQYELRLYRTEDESLQRAYFSGIVGHTTGIEVPGAAYLHDVARPFASVEDLERTMLAGAIAERLESTFGAEWWADPEARALTDRLGSAPSGEDVLAELGYDAYDWRPVLRQIRTRLVGEMSGYGGPNITTRAGTRKV